MKNSRLHPVWLVAFVLALSIAAIAGKPLPDIPVVSSVAGDGQVLADATIPNYRLQSDGLGDYFNGVEGVISILQGNGDWELDTGRSSVRRLMLDLREPYDATATPPFSYAMIPGRFIAKCPAVGPGSIGGMRGLNTTIVCFMNLTFGLGRDSWVLTMNRAAYADVNDVLVTCTDVSGDPSDPNAPCTGWTIDPTVTDSTGPRNLGRLLRRLKGGALEDHGRFYMRFHISFHK